MYLNNSLFKRFVSLANLKRKMHQGHQNECLIDCNRPLFSWSFYQPLSTGLILLSCSFNAYSSDTVDIYVSPSIQTERLLHLQYSAPVRVSQILQDSLQNLDKLSLPNGQNTSAVYWTNASLFTQKSDNHISALKRRVLNNMSVIYHMLGSTTEKASFDAYRSWLSTLTTQKRAMYALDFDAVRVKTENNPELANDMLLVLPPRPNSVKIVGAISETIYTSRQSGFLQRPWTERSNAADYLKSLVRFQAADSSYVWVIQPDGETEQHPVAYWNSEHKDIAPGAIIYVPFASLPDGAAFFNDKMIALLRNSAL